MRIALALDTSGPAGSVALLRERDDGAAEVLGREAISAGMRHGVELFPALERLLSGAGVGARDLSVVAVGTGPGSYTGLRVGVTAARALAYAAGVELLGVPSCDAWARGCDAPGEELAVVLDAQVRAVYLALYRRGAGGWERTLGPEFLDPVDAASRIPTGATVVGDGPAAYAEAFTAVAVHGDAHGAEAAHVGWIALARHARGERQAIDEVVPLYLRATEAERKWEKRHGG